MISRIVRTAKRGAERARERARRARLDRMSPEEVEAILEGFLEALAQRPPRKPRRTPRTGGAWRPSTDRPATLDGRWADVARMARSHRSLWSACLRAGWDPDDLEQEVQLRALARQDMGSRYDPSRSGVGKYLFVLTRSILSNLLSRAKGRSAERPVDDPEGWDPADREGPQDSGADLLEHLADLVVEGSLPASAPEVARHMIAGRTTRRDLVAATGFDAAQVREAVAALRALHDLAAA